jgi:hypothetical protein
MNPLFNMFGNQPNSGPFNNMNNVLNQFNRFQSTFQGDPKQKVQDLLNSGQMSQEQFNQLSSMAQVFQTLLGRR